MTQNEFPFSNTSATNQLWELMIGEMLVVAELWKAQKESINDNGIQTVTISFDSGYSKFSWLWSKRVSAGWDDRKLSCLWSPDLSTLSFEGICDNIHLYRTFSRCGTVKRQHSTTEMYHQNKIVLVSISFLSFAQSHLILLQLGYL